MSVPVEHTEDAGSRTLSDVERGRRIVSVIMIAGGLLYTAASLRLDRGDLAHPGPGLFPVLIGLLAVVGGIGGLIELRRGEIGAVSDGDSGGAKPWLFVAAMGVGIILLPTLGYMVSAFVTSTAVGRVAGQKSLKRAVIVGLVIALTSTLLFREVLDVVLPSSVLDEWL